ncbi:Glycerol-3-phosphate dehydrogenase/dihydroxyacetone 3-phosphate reductase [Trachipleistophora hominis]|uniref:Glycerol-3-phosphate dehydrogenase [NAD(+)] n=1 Tax=Trachipleistophora hominis TaxID=72359 RepID=L7JY76_TRAHO|nr:Glycerol-3-phosphate dehydrogenase/dihydroxyacetone 3-phosphate reductase [Trachipleistophora hominis]
MELYRIGIIGSGSFGTAIANIIARDVQNKSVFDDTVKIWIFDEQVRIDGSKELLSEYIKRERENVNYLPHVKLPENLLFMTNLKEVVQKSDILVFVVPHQFIEKIVQDLKSMKLKKKIACSLMKGTLFSEETAEIVLISNYIEKELGWPCSAVMGANIASEMHKSVCEMTIGSRTDGDLLKQLFNTPQVKVNVVRDKTSVELFGALKNIVAIAFGVARGLQLSINTQVSIMRRGMLEMIEFVKMVDKNADKLTILESCGIADLMVSCITGRNAGCGTAIASKGLTIEKIEEDMKGQKLQGTLCAYEVMMYLRKKNVVDKFPVFATVYGICYGKMDSNQILKVFEE